MNTILVPTDFSKCANNAAKYAILLAEKYKSRLIFFHSAFQPIITQSLTEVYLQAVETEKKIKTKTLADNIGIIYNELSKKMDENKSRFIVMFNANVVEDIIEMIKNENIDLVIMGTKGAGGLKEIFIGSNTAKVIERAKCPVIAVPEDASFIEIRNITYATDYHESDIEALKKLVEIAKPFNAKINIVHAADEEFTPQFEEFEINKFKNIVRNNIKYSKISFGVEYGKYLEDILQDHIKEEAPDLLAMSTQDRNLMGKILGTSLTKRMAYHTNVPLLAFHHKKESLVFI